MKILYAIQGTGNGHITRAREIIESMRTRVDFDVLLSGSHCEIDLGYPIKYRFKGLGFKFGKRGGFDFVATWKEGSYRHFMDELTGLDLSHYDMVLNDFEPVSAWAAKRQHVPCIGLSNQCVLMDRKIPKPDYRAKNVLSLAIIRHYAPVDAAYGFHYTPIDHFISAPIVRDGIRKLETSDEGEYLVYLPFYSDAKLVKTFQQFPETRWNVFSKHAERSTVEGNVTIRPLDSDVFEFYLARASGVLSAAGFGLTTEVLFLGKKLLIIPMKGQYEQRCNAFSLKELGIPVLKSLKRKWFPTISKWIAAEITTQIQYQTDVDALVDRILTDFSAMNTSMDVSDIREQSIQRQRI